MIERKIEDYKDIIDLPYAQSKNHHNMSLNDRAAQFSPFAALNGYEESIDEAGRLTDEERKLTQEEKLIIDDKLRFINDNLNMHYQVEIEYFVPDKKKSGGAYNKIRGSIHRIDEIEKVIIMETKEKIKISSIVDLKSDIFSSLY